MNRIALILKEGKSYVRNSSFPVGHYYSPIVNLAEYKKALVYQVETDALRNITLNESEQLVLLDHFSVFKNEIPAWDGADGNRYRLDNGWYPSTDGIILYSMLRVFQPKQIIEVGSGYSSALMLDVNDHFQNHEIRFTFVEPNPDRLHLLLRDNDWKHVRILEQYVQRVPLTDFAALEENDVLLIDSSHVSKTGSDVNYLLFQVLPVLKPGVIIHLHDVFFPFEYPADWILSGRNWNEIYLLRAFLQNNNDYEILFFTDFMKQTHGDLFAEKTGIKHSLNGSSIYLRKIR